MVMIIWRSVQLLGQQLITLHQRIETLLELALEQLRQLVQKLFIGLDLLFQFINATLQQLMLC